MRKESVNFLRELIAAPSPSGFEGPAQKVWMQRTAPFADEIKVDVHGNVIAVDLIENRIPVRDVPIHRRIAHADVWVPLGTHPLNGYFDRLMGGAEAVYLLEPGASASDPGAGRASGRLSGSRL